MTEPTRIVVADGATTNPGDLSWAPLEALGDLVVHERSGDALLEHCRGAQVVLTNKEMFPRQILEQLPQLKFISVLATGTNVVDLAAANELGIVVSNVPAYSTDAVAQHVFALLLALQNRVAEHAGAASRGEWTRSGDFSYRLGPIHELAGKTLGIVGLGTIGRAVARIGAAFGMNLVAAGNPSKPRPERERLQPEGISVHWRSLDDVFAEADVVTLHCPLTAQTRGLVNAARLNAMKSSALLINTGRGDLVDEAALLDALDNERIAGAGLDVLSQEPPAEDHGLLKQQRCYVTPHLAWASVEARRRLLQVSADNVSAFLRGAPQNVVRGG